MRKELDDALCAKYPKIFRDRNAPMTETCMCWGFPGDGWYDIIDNLCGAIQDRCDNVKIWNVQDDPDSDHDPDNKTIPDLINVPQVVAVQVKEKFGTLRFYFDGGDDEVHGMVSMAEYMSKHTCEECGKPGKLRHGGWVRTLCDEHAHEFGYENEDEE